MPIEIRELIIKATVAEAQANDAGPPPASDGGREAIVEACVRQVLRILRRSEER